jgi:D-xylose transport system substrate-binding protein
VLSGLLLASCGNQATSLDGEESATDELSLTDSSDVSAEEILDSETGAKACVLFYGDGPDDRFAREDERLLASAFTSAGLRHQIANAKGDIEQFNLLANEFIGGDCFVLFMASPDSSTGVAVIAKAQERGIPVIDYENLTLGGGADYHLGFDLVSVGVAQGEAMLECLPSKVRNPKIVYLNGSPTDVNATLLKLGYASVLEGAAGKKAKVKIVDDQSVPDWGDDLVADIVALVWARADEKINGLVAASDGLAIAALASVPGNKATSTGNNLDLAVVGQGATVAGLQALVDGTLCATVYKPVKDLAKGAAEMALAIRDEGSFDTDDTLIDIATSVPIPAKLILVRKITAPDVREVLIDSGVLVSEVCGGERRVPCEALGIA